MNQFNFLKSFDDFKVDELSFVLRISTKTYEKIIKNGYDIEKEKGRSPLVTKDEEKEFLAKMREQQMRGDCMSPREARKWLENHLAKKGKTVDINRLWWYRFRKKHRNIFGVFKIHSIESKRCSIDKDIVEEYYKNLDAELRNGYIPSLVLNMDESGFIKRPDKDSLKNCICFNDCTVKPTFREDNDGNHISVVAAVTLSGIALKPLLISTTLNPPKEVVDSPIGNKFLWAKTSKGYLNEKTMIFWIQMILIPYVTAVRSATGNYGPALLIFDGLASHKTDAVTNLLQQNNIRFLCYPPNCTHILQCLDLCFFGVLKKEYKIAESTLFVITQKQARKIERILKAFHRACFITNIIGGWISSGIELSYQNGEISHIFVNKYKALNKLNSPNLDI